MSIRAFTFENTKPVITDAELLSDIRDVAVEGFGEAVEERQCGRSRGRRRRRGWVAIGPPPQ